MESKIQNFWEDRSRRERMLLIVLLFMGTFFLINKYMIKNLVCDYKEIVEGNESNTSFQDLDLLKDQYNEKLIYYNGIKKPIESKVIEKLDDLDIDGLNDFMANQKLIQIKEVRYESITADNDDSLHIYPMHLQYIATPDGMKYFIEERQLKFPYLLTEKMEITEMDDWLKVSETINIYSFAEIPKQGFTNIVTGKDIIDDEIELLKDRKENVNEDSIIYTDEQKDGPEIIVNSEEILDNIQENMKKIDSELLIFNVSNNASEVNLQKSNNGSVEIQYNLISYGDSESIIMKAYEPAKPANREVVLYLDSSKSLKGEFKIFGRNGSGKLVTSDMEITNQGVKGALPENIALEGIVYSISKGNGENGTWTIKEVIILE
ncbi:MAG: hypothetical protein GXZ11_01055 [Tissierellia bacterium]|nr:hypothetical protein [Tissierellia bacterium]